MRVEKYIVFKNVFDCIFAGILFLLLWPLFLSIAIWIKLDSPGPILFRQKRIGKNNEVFEIFKFRSMRLDAPQNIPTHLLHDADSLITKSGRFLRNSSLDELPQLYNILKGEMSFIGPRPALWNQFDLIKGRKEVMVELLKPGITGWAQINGRDEISITEKIALDEYYLKNISLLMDIKILLLTILSVITKKGIREGTVDEAEDAVVGPPMQEKEERCI
ncbi:sugar transferase [Anaerovorax sp. IOR16]|uniref:sugar transferase n=1 Tax=Anaerovorax sp. IOR16 TaxID=2773458 RepID=UPI0019CF8D42|nr:sugar transferase [Anaerovorax sp. IOR16]